MAKKTITKNCKLFLIFLVILIALFLIMNSNSNKEYFTNLKENYNNFIEQGSCGTCKLKN